MGRAWPELEARGVRALAVGGGSMGLAKRMAGILKLPFPLLCDPDRAVLRRYGFERVMAGLLQQSGFILVDGAGVVRHVHRATNPGASLDLRELWNAIAALERPAG